jgi:hypothetical protein
MITADELQQLINTQPAAQIKPLSDLPRARYWREYHEHRQATDPSYRARRVEAALRAKDRRKA